MKNKSIQIKRSSLPPRLVNENENGIRIKVYIQGHMIGAGKMELFHLVAEKGSIRSAAKAMGMSTKRATLLLKTIEEAFPNPILEKQPGNKGTLVTSFGKLKLHLVKIKIVFIIFNTLNNFIHNTYRFNRVFSHSRFCR